MGFRRFGIFRTPHGWHGYDGDGNLIQRGLKRKNEDAVNESVDFGKPLQAFLRDGKIRVTSGTIGNKIPTIGGLPINNPLAGINPFTLQFNGLYQLVATCPATSNGYTMFPSSAPTLSMMLSVPTDTDTEAFVSLASITVAGNQDQFQIQNHLSGSLWGERVKLTDEPAIYYFNLI